jgi:hypothetical protein
VTDHKPNTFFASQASLPPKKVRWLDFLSHFSDMKCLYRPGRLNVADPLSRAPHLPAAELADPVCLPLFIATPLSDNQVWAAAYAADPWFREARHTQGLSFRAGHW